MASDKDRFTLSFVDEVGRKRFLIWKPPVHQREAAARALASGESIEVRGEDRVRVTFRD